MYITQNNKSSVQSDHDHGLKKVITLPLKLVVFIVCLCFQAHVSSISAVYFCFVSDIQQLTGTMP